jgi:hypothetical protein
MKDKLAAIASLVVTAVLSTCCTLPLALASIGLGSLSHRRTAYHQCNHSPRSGAVSH